METLDVAALKTVLATLVFVAAIPQGLFQAQLSYRNFRIFPISKEKLRLAHRWLGDAILVIVLIVACLCIATYSPIYLYSLRIPLHIAFGALTSLSLLAKLVISRWARSYLRYARLLGLAILFFISGSFFTSAFFYLFRL